MMIPLTNMLLLITGVISLYFAVFWFLVFIEGGAIPDKKKVLTTFPLVTIAIPVWNEVQRKRTGEVRCVVEDTLDHVMQLDYPADKLQVIIINDGSSDDSKKHILKSIHKYPERNILFIDKVKNEGKGEAFNSAMKKATGEYFVTLDADSVMPSSVLKQLLAYFTDENIACVCPNMQVMSPKTVLEKMQWYEYMVNMFLKKLMGAKNCVHVAPGPFTVYKTGILQEVGGFREAYLTEDLELTLRLQKNQYTVLQVLDVVVETKCPPSFKAFYAQRNRWFKGSTLNALQYKEMMFNPKYGDFGMLQMPFIIVPALLAVFMMIVIVKNAVLPAVDVIKVFSLINFDIITFIKGVRFTWIPVDLDYFTIVVIGVMSIISLIMLKKAHEYSKERILKQGVFPLLVFFVFYYILLTLAWAGVFFDIITRRKMKW
jgi:cellulose synthase/poly-beta-1,6-N-acetylglucosamine synthase-like glycosyltransferase